MRFSLVLIALCLCLAQFCAARPHTDATLGVDHRADDADQETTTAAVALEGTSINLERAAAGVIFRNLQIERGFKVNSAKVSFYSASSNSYAAVTTIRAEKTCSPVVYGVLQNDDKEKDKDDDKGDDKEKDKEHLNSAHFELMSDKDKDKSSSPVPPSGLSARMPTTDAVVTWSTAWVKESRYYTADISPIVQEIVSLPTWAKGNSISLLFSGEGGTKHRKAYSLDGNTAKAPQLILNYDTPASCAPLEQTASYTVTCEAGAYGMDFEGTHCIQSCDSGYRGCEQTRVCGSDGQWTGTNVVCTALIQSSPGDLQKKLLNEGAGPYHCNDGTSPSYYIRDSSSKKWIIMFEGGGLCFNAQTCTNRINTTPFFTSSTWNSNNPIDIFNAPTRVGQGILSKDPSSNSHWADANVVFVHYCSSDMWSGTRTSAVPLSATMNFWFQGHFIMNAVIDELRAKYDLGCATSILLAGESASGGVGLTVQMDRLAGSIHTFAPQADIRALLDGSFVIPVVDPLKLFNPAVPKVNDIIQASQAVWQPIIPDACVAAGFVGATAWKCFFSAEAQNIHTVPTFYYQAQYDMPQVGQNGVITPIDTQAEMDYCDLNLAAPVQQNFRDIRLTPRDGGFTPRCQGHKNADKPEWASTNVNGLIYRDAFQQWYDRTDLANPTQTFVTVDDCVGFSCNPSCPVVWI